ncbi:MAG TPA: hypothetical protein DCF68_21015 [Cyanothece sp. UBA12306]|nr:hypothetical protein [Cyanothece sp. UBA12306]
MIKKLFLNILSLICLPIGSVFAQGRLDRPEFFRDGQMQMEREIQRLQQQSQQQPTTGVEHPSQLLTIDQGKLRWQKYLFQDGGFSVWMPEGIKSQETIVLNLAGNKLPFEVFATQPQNYRFVSAYSVTLKPDQLANSTQLLSLVRDGIVTETNFTLVSDKPTTWQGYSGLELTMTDQDELIGFRVYVINDRVYVLAAGQKNISSLSEEIASFFDSFRLLE